MASFVQTVDNLLGSLVCGTLGLYVNDPVFPLPLPYVQDFYRRNCNREPPPPPPPPFQGGQCLCVVYNVSFTLQVPRPGDGQIETYNQNFAVYGPVGSIFLRKTAEQPGISDVWEQVIIARGNAIGVCQGAPLESVASPFSVQNGGTPTLSQIQITRANGQPDTCGNPPPPPPPPFPIVVDPVTVVYDDDDGQPISIDINPIIGFPVIVNNDLSFPISLNYNNPELNIPVELDLNLTFERDSDGDPRPRTEPEPPGDRRPPGNGSERPGREPEDYSTPDYVEPNPDGDPDGEPPPPEDDCPATRPRPQVEVPIIRGVVVSVRDKGTRASVISSQGTGGLPILVPAVGWIQFRVPINAFQTAWLTDIPVKNQRQLIPVPWEGGATAWEFIPNGTDVIVDVEPVYGSSEVASRRDRANPSC